jgi:tripartite-type tricarboxylate transporter receptor subunit TctC
MPRAAFHRRVDAGFGQRRRVVLRPWPKPGRRDPVRIIVPYAPGGTIDITARLMMSKLSQSWGQPVVIDNRAGAAGTIGANMVAKAAPDGYTLLLAAASELTIAQAIIKDMPFNALTDFTPIVLVARSPFVLVVNSKVPAKNLAELIALAKRQPGKLNYGTFRAQAPPRIWSPSSSIRRPASRPLISRTKAAAS